MIIEKCPESAPLMQQAWLDCLHWSIAFGPHLNRFTEDTGIRFSRSAGSPIERMIDDATKVHEKVIVSYIDWFNENVWGDSEVEPVAVVEGVQP